MGGRVLAGGRRVNRLPLPADLRVEEAAEASGLRFRFSLPRGAYATSLDTAEELRFVLHEERKREFFAEGGRYWSTKIQNADMSWFPRAQGATPFQGYSYAGGVRQLFAGSEYQANPYFIAAGGLDARASGCVNEWPGGGAQAPKIIGVN